MNVLPYYLSENTNITLDMIMAYPNKNWNWQ